MKKKIIVSILLLSSSLSFSKISGIKDVFQITTGATLMPTILPTYVTVMHFNPPPYLKRQREIYKFIEKNLESLKEEIAKGEGEYLDTLATLYELKEKERWKIYLQSHFNEIFSDTKTEHEIVSTIDELTYGEFKASTLYEMVIETNETKP